MSRASTPAPITVAPSNNIYTALAAAATVAVAMGLIILFLRANAMGINLFKM